MSPVFTPLCNISNTPQQESGGVLKGHISVVIHPIWLLHVSFAFLDHFQLCISFDLQFLDDSQLSKVYLQVF